MHNRIKKIRTKLGLSQAAFGEKIGLKQKAIGLIEQGVNKLTERNFEAICREFKINPDWLRTGEGEMLDTSAKTPLDVLCEGYDLGDTERLILQVYLEFPPEQRVIIAEYIQQTLEFYQRMNATEPKAKRKRDLLEKRAQIDAELATIDGGAASNPIAKESSDAAG